MKIYLTAICLLAASCSKKSEDPANTWTNNDLEITVHQSSGSSYTSSFHGILAPMYTNYLGEFSVDGERTTAEQEITFSRLASDPTGSTIACDYFGSTPFYSDPASRQHHVHDFCKQYSSKVFNVKCKSFS